MNKSEIRDTSITIDVNKFAYQATQLIAEAKGISFEECAGDIYIEGIKTIIPSLKNQIKDLKNKSRYT